MAVPGSQRASRSWYHGAACPPGIQFATGRSPRTIRTSAAAIVTYFASVPS